MLCTAGQLARHTASALSNTGSGMIDFEKWYVSGLPLPLIAACAACQKGVKRAHLVDARLDGALLLELYSRDGVGTMLSADFYEVCSTARRCAHLSSGWKYCERHVMPFSSKRCFVFGPPPPRVFPCLCLGPAMQQHTCI